MRHGIFDGMFGGTAIMLVVMFVYLVPTLIAAARHTQNRIAILNLNFLLGWTLIGSVVALFWSLSRDAAIERLPAHIGSTNVGRIEFDELGTPKLESLTIPSQGRRTT